jgi:MoaA/NifB/PqqE/SkfB family radical SAM enzyme
LTAEVFKLGQALPASAFAATSIDLYLTSACNRQCSYCFLSESFFANRQHMSVGTVAEIVRWTAESTIEEITLLGGEPAMHPDFVAIVALIKAAGLAVRTVTNGSSKFRAAMTHGPTSAAMDRVAVSLDVPNPELFDQLRGRGAFKDAMRTIELLALARKQFDINFTVVKSALPYVRQMLRFAEDLGARRINMHWFSPVGRGKLNAQHETVSSDEWREVLDVVAGYSPSRGDFIVDCELGYELGYRGEDRKMCAVRDRTNLQFMPDGSVFSCGMLVERPDLAGYMWRGGGLHLRQAESEVTRTATPCGGCPMRVKVAAVSNDGAPEPLPLCIYNRLDRSPAH